MILKASFLYLPLYMPAELAFERVSSGGSILPIAREIFFFDISIFWLNLSPSRSNATWACEEVGWKHCGLGYISGRRGGHMILTLAHWLNPKSSVCGGGGLAALCVLLFLPLTFLCCGYVQGILCGNVCFSSVGVTDGGSSRFLLLWWFVGYFFGGSGGATYLLWAPP